VRPRQAHAARFAADDVGRSVQIISPKIAAPIGAMIEPPVKALVFHTQFAARG
jgi:hypothetical protein